MAGSQRSMWMSRSSYMTSNRVTLCLCELDSDVKELDSDVKELVHDKQSIHTV
uniref:Uncharacterized protein n=1 Tax=Arundo donax TaxID=35708 RepID=A0A0A8YZZ0_ARUDO